MSQCGRDDCKQRNGSSKCMRIQWESVFANKPNVWLTDIKIDTFGNAAMQKKWNRFKENAWLSFNINTANADSVYLQFVVFTKDENDKWGSREMIGFKSNRWKMIKLRLGDLSYDNWGKGNSATPDFNTIIPARIEIGLRSVYANDKGKIDVRIDDVVVSNYEP